MKTKHVITIGILSAVAVALLGIAVALGKVNKPKTLQTNAVYELQSISGNATNPEWQITGEPYPYNVSFYQNNGLPVMPEFNYRITYQNNKLTLVNDITALFYLDTDEIPNVINRTTVVGGHSTVIRQLQNVTDKINYVEIKLVNVIFSNVGTTNNVQTSIYYRFYTDNDNYFMPVNNYFRISTDVFNDDIVDESVLVDTFYLNLNAYTTGYTTGYQIKGDLEDGNFLTFRNTMLEILTMPFTFINQAFDVTLWEGTAYAVNIGNFIKGIIAILSIIFIIKLFTSGFSTLSNYIPNVKNTRKTSKPTTKQTSKTTTTKQRKITKHEKKVEKQMNDGFTRG